MPLWVTVLAPLSGDSLSAVITAQQSGREGIPAALPFALGATCAGDVLLPQEQL